MSSPHPELCVGAIVVHGDRLLLVRRGRGAGTGLWSIPGGRVELGETMEQAVRRELSEETGLEAREVSYVAHVERLGEGWHFVIHDHLVTIDDAAGAVAGDDAAEVAWIPLDRLDSTDGLVPGLVDFLDEHGLR